MSNLVLNEEESRAVEEGAAAQHLLDAPAFLLAIEAVRQDCAETILTSAPTDLQAREDAYQLSRGLTAVTQRLADLAAQGEATLAFAETETETDFDPSDSPIEDEPSF